jgi:hypothetical protein
VSCPGGSCDTARSDEEEHDARKHRAHDAELAQIWMAALWGCPAPSRICSSGGTRAASDAASSFGLAPKPAPATGAARIAAPKLRQISTRSRE